MLYAGFLDARTSEYGRQQNKKEGYNNIETVSFLFLLWSKRRRRKLSNGGMSSLTWVGYHLLSGAISFQSISCPSGRRPNGGQRWPRVKPAKNQDDEEKRNPFSTPKKKKNSSSDSRQTNQTGASYQKVASLFPTHFHGCPS